MRYLRSIFVIICLLYVFASQIKEEGRELVHACVARRQANAIVHTLYSTAVSKLYTSRSYSISAIETNDSKPNCWLIKQTYIRTERPTQLYFSISISWVDCILHTKHKGTEKQRHRSRRIIYTYIFIRAHSIHPACLPVFSSNPAVPIDRGDCVCLCIIYYMWRQSVFVLLGLILLIWLASRPPPAS